MVVLVNCGHTMSDISDLGLSVRNINKESKIVS